MANRKNRNESGLSNRDNRLVQKAAEKAAGKVLQDLIANVPAANKGQVSQVIEESIVVSESHKRHSGPLPSPEVLKEYEKLYHGISKKMFDSFLGETSHRQRVDKWLLIHEILRSWGGLICGFLVATLGIAGGLYVALHATNISGAVVGGIVSGGSLASIVYCFVVGRKAEEPVQKKENKNLAATDQEEKK